MALRMLKDGKNSCSSRLIGSYCLHHYTTINKTNVNTNISQYLFLQSLDASMLCTMWNVWKNVLMMVSGKTFLDILLNEQIIRELFWFYLIFPHSIAALKIHNGNAQKKKKNKQFDLELFFIRNSLILAKCLKKEREYVQDGVGSFTRNYQSESVCVFVWLDA